MAVIVSHNTIIKWVAKVAFALPFNLHIFYRFLAIHPYQSDSICKAYQHFVKRVQGNRPNISTHLQLIYILSDKGFYTFMLHIERYTHLSVSERWTQLSLSCLWIYSSVPLTKCIYFLSTFIILLMNGLVIIFSCQLVHSLKQDLNWPEFSFMIVPNVLNFAPFNLN